MSFDLKQLLEECRGYDDRRWVLWAVDWQAAPHPLEDIAYFSREWYLPLEHAPNNQMQVSFSALQKCAEHIGQTENGFFLAVRPGCQQIPMLHSLSDCEEISDLIIHAFDFSFWEVTTENDNLIQRLASKYTQTEVFDEMMNGGSPIPRR